jgi:hypothetical protein
LNDHGLALTATTGYQPFTVLAVAPPETAMVQAWLWKDAGSGYLLVDELSLAAEPNLLQNPGFEEGLSPWFQSGEVSLSNQAHSGAAALRLGTDSGGSWQSPVALAGEPYHFSGWAWLDGSDDAWAGLTFYDAGWTALAEESRLLLPAGSYQPFTIQAEAPAGTTYVGAWLWKNEGRATCMPTT